MVRGCGAVCVVHGDCAHPFQKLLLCVQTVVVTTWFSWLCPWEPPMGSRDRRSSCQLPRNPLVLSVSLLAKVTTATGPTVPHLKPPQTAAGGAPVPVSTGEIRKGWCLGEGRGAHRGGEMELGQPGRVHGPLLVPSP